MRTRQIVCLSAAIAWLGCSSSSDTPQATGTGATPSNQAGVGGEQAAGASGSSSNAGSPGAGGGAAGDSNGGGGAAGSNTSDASAGASVVVVDSGADVGGGGKTDAGKASYSCTLVIGLLVTAEWYAAGFEQVVTDANWEIKAAHYAYTQEWANPNSTFWATPISSPCAKNPDMPDRVIYVALNWDYTTEKQWEDDVTKDVNVIQTKYPSAKNIELLSIVRCPLACGTPPARPAETCYVAPVTDQALAAVAAKMPDLVTVGPKFEDDACADFPNLGTHMTTAATAATGKKIGDYYATH